MATVQVILREKIKNLGSEADIVSVKAGYARNFLVPHGKAFEATPGNTRHLNNLKARRNEREAGERAEAQSVAARLRKLTLNLELATGGQGKAFGAITASDLAAALQEQAKVTVDRHAIALEKPIKTTGKHEVSVRLHTDVEVTIKIAVKAAGAAEAVEEAAAEAAAAE